MGRGISTVAEAFEREPSLLPVARPVEEVAPVAAATPVAATLDDVTFDIVSPTNSREAATVATASAESVSQTRYGNVTTARLAKSVGELRKPYLPTRSKETGADHDSQHHQAMLAALNVRQLRQRATSVGVDAAAIEHARDSDDPKAAIIALIVARAQSKETGADHDSQHHQAMLAALNVGQLRQRATSVGVDAAAIEHARDSDDPKAAIIALIVARAQ
jgi:hypothetical protein